MADNKVLHKCLKCSKVYKNNASLQKHAEKCTEKCAEKCATKPVLGSSTIPSNAAEPKPTATENTYDVSMTFGEGNKVHVDIKKQPNDTTKDDSDDESDSGEKVLKDILRPKVSHTYQDEIDKLENLVKMFKTLPISDDPARKDHTIEQLKQTVTILMTQSRNIIKEMKQMSRRNSYYRNNIMLAAFILDNCRKDVPETDEEFENMFS